MNLYYFVQKFSLSSLLFASLHVGAMDNNDQNTQPSLLQVRYITLKNSRPNLITLNHMHLKNYMRNCQILRTEAIVKNEQSIATEMYKTIGQINNFLRRHNLQ